MMRTTKVFFILIFLENNFKINSNVSYNNGNNNLVNKDPFLSITIEKVKINL